MSEPITPIPPTPLQPSTRDPRWFFLGPNGLRAGWGVFLFVCLVALTATLLSWALRPVMGPMDPMRPFGMIFVEGLLFVSVLIPTLVMARIEGRPLGVYGLPLERAFSGEFWNGAFWGVAMLSVVMACMAAVHAYTFGRIVLTPTQVLEYGLLWALGFLMVGFFEEYTFRGYLLYTLTRGIGFWPAAVVTSALFALVHRENPGETWVGLAEIFLIAMAFCLSVRRTGSLWWAVGIHMSYDWGESFLYSVPNSGNVVFGHLSDARLHGNSWLSGGTVGPEASVFNMVGEASLLLVVLWIYPKIKYPTGVERPQPTVAEERPILNLNDAETGEFPAQPPQQHDRNA